MIKAGIVGVTGYSGIELFHILRLHPEVEITAIKSNSYNGKPLGAIYPHLADEKIVCKDYSPAEMAELCDVVFTAVPHGGASFEYAQAVKKSGKKLIDLSADFRLKNIDVYEKWYGIKHALPGLLKEAVYGLPELHRNEIKNAWLVANPGCYTTCSILASSPLMNEDFIEPASIIVDAKSGTSGAGRKLKENLQFSEMDESFSAYNIAGGHRHTPEIEQELSFVSGREIIITFTPHLVPMVRGILAATYINVKKNVELKKIVEKFKKFYDTHPFVRILEEHLPNTKYVAGMNFIDIAIRYDERAKKLVIISSLDNLIKGASGQAVQNMNLAFGLPEDMGLRFKPVYPCKKNFYTEHTKGSSRASCSSLHSGHRDHRTDFIF